jgi:DNA processing protein
MSTDDAHADAAAILGLLNLPRVGIVAIHRILAALAEREIQIRYLLEYDEGSLVEEGLLTEAQAERFVSQEERDVRTATMDQLETADIHLLPITASDYPACLRAKRPAMRPPLLMVRGNVDLLDPGGIAFAGARRSSPRGLEITRALVGRAVEQRFTVISGGAAGTDLEAHEEALASDGSTIVVLAEGICTPRARQFDAMLETARAAVVSTFPPGDPWQAWRAMERNRTILGLCDRLVVVEAGVRGGTLAAGKQALGDDVPVWVLDYAVPPESAAGSRLLLEMGARPIPVPDRGDVVIPPELFTIEGWVVSRVRR